MNICLGVSEKGEHSSLFQLVHNIYLYYKPRLLANLLRSSGHLLSSSATALCDALRVDSPSMLSSTQGASYLAVPRFSCSGCLNPMTIADRDPSQLTRRVFWVYSYDLRQGSLTYSEPFFSADSPHPGHKEDLKMHLLTDTYCQVQNILVSS